MADNVGMMGQLADQGAAEMGGPGPGPSGPMMGQGGPGQAAGGPGQAPGGPGPDTPQEQQALKLFMQGGQAFRQAAQVEPSIRWIVDKALQQMFLEITKHYGMEQEGKLAMQQHKLASDKQKSAQVMGPPTAGPEI